MTATESSHQPQRNDGIRTAFGVGGLIAIVIGLLILFYPGKSAVVSMTIVAGILAAYALVTGAVYVGSAIFSKSQGGWARTGHIVLGLLYVVAGVVLMVNLTATGGFLALFLAIVIGVMWMMEGITALFTLSQNPNRVWTIIYSIISIIAGLTLAFSPLMGAITLWWLLGIGLVVMGVVQVVRAFKS
ncbi:MAG: HdeD family acid-resistance protein [Leucobacter sp.]